MRRKIIGRRLKFARERAGLPLRHPAIVSRVGSSRTAQRLESGQATQLTFPVIGSLCDLYGLPPEEKYELERLWDLGEATSWTQPKAERALGFSAYQELQLMASQVCTFESFYIPGWIQTQKYMRSLFSSNRALGADQIEEAIEIRTSKQDSFWEAQDCKHHILLGESALRGGCDKAQIDRVREAAELDHVTIRYLPLDRVPSPLLLLPFRILSFPAIGDPDIAYVETLADWVFYEDAEPVEFYRQGFKSGDLDAEPIERFKP